MEDYEKEKFISTSPGPLSIEGVKKILGQMDNSTCKIYNNCEGTGFFTKIPYNLKLLPVLITNNHIISKDDINNNKNITLLLNNAKKIKTIKLDNNRLRYTNEKLDITIIEIKENEDNLNNKYLELDDEIINYFNDNKNESPTYMNNIYSNKSIYLINYPDDKDVFVSFGQPPKLNDTEEIMHKCVTKEGSSGSPILLMNNQKLIGIHYGTYKKYEDNKGILIIYSIIELNKIKGKKLIINKEGTLNNNGIDEEIFFNCNNKKDEKNIRKINSYKPISLLNRQNCFFNHINNYEYKFGVDEHFGTIIKNNLNKHSYFYKNNRRKYQNKSNLTISTRYFNQNSSSKNMNISNSSSIEKIKFVERTEINRNKSDSHLKNYKKILFKDKKEYYGIQKVATAKNNEKRQKLYLNLQNNPEFLTDKLKKNNDYNNKKFNITEKKKEKNKSNDEIEIESTKKCLFQIKEEKEKKEDKLKKCKTKIKQNKNIYLRLKEENNKNQVSYLSNDKDNIYSLSNIGSKKLQKSTDYTKEDKVLETNQSVQKSKIPKKKIKNSKHKSSCNIEYGNYNNLTSFEEGKIKNGRKLLIAVGVTIRKGLEKKKIKIDIYEGDTPDLVVEKFAKKYNLEKEVENILQKNIRQYMLEFKNEIIYKNLQIISKNNNI